MRRSRHSAAFLVLALLIAVALPFASYWWMNARHQDAMQALQQEVSRLRADERRSGADSQRTKARADIDGLQAQLEGHDQLTARLERLHRIATGYGVLISKAGYTVRSAEADTGGISRYEVRLETEAPYYQLRFFLRDLLAEDPLLALEALELRRPPGGGYNVGGSSILATLHIVMYFGNPQR